MDKKYHYKNSHKLEEVRKFLRMNATGAEKILWTHVRGKQLGYKFRRQYSIGNYVVDFCCEQAKVVVELDGWTHDSEKTKLKDKNKQVYLESLGYKVLRFTNEQVYGDVEKVLDEIKKWASSPI